MREIVNINTNWKFIKDDVGIEQASIADGDLIDLPHTWNHDDGQDGGDDYYRGTCYYVKKFIKPKLNNNEQVYIEFQGVNSSAQVMLNGKNILYHEGGYSTFRANITEELQDNNTLIVAVDNSENDKVYPQLADFTFYGGIYRDVSLIIVSKNHFSLDYYGGNGIMVTPLVKGKHSEVSIKTLVTGRYDDIRITVEGVESKFGNEVIIKIPNVRLWNGIKDPYLYTAKAELILDGRVVDTVSTRFGCRSFSVDSDEGFILNGEKYSLRGVSRHQDREGIGNALTKEMHLEDIKLIAEMGANTIRLAHYQHDKYFYDLCDEYGMVVWAEIPYITKHMDNGRDNTISQMTELIIQNYNHPSIAFWGLSNEITGGGITDKLVENNKELHELCHKLDPNRLTAMAHIFLLDMESPLLDIADLNSYNLYYGWYLGDFQENNEFFDEFRRKYTEKPIGLSEYGCEAVLQWQTSNPQKGDYTEQYQALYHEHMCEMIDNRPYLWSTYVWNMFDFGADARDEGGVKGRNNKGLVTFDRKIKKDSFYIYKAYFSEQAFVHICGRRYIDRNEEVTQVKVYSNQEKVSLYNNGNLVGEKEGNKIFVFDLELEEENNIEAKSNGSSDSIVIKKTNQPNLDYVFEVEEISNWFEGIDLQFPKDYYSVKDKIGDIIKTEEGKQLVSKLQNVRTKRQDGLAENIDIDAETRMRLMKDIPFLTVINNAKIPADSIVEINKELNKIKKI